MTVQYLVFERFYPNIFTNLIDSGDKKFLKDYKKVEQLMVACDQLRSMEIELEFNKNLVIGTLKKEILDIIFRNKYYPTVVSGATEIIVETDRFLRNLDVEIVRVEGDMITVKDITQEQVDLLNAHLASKYSSVIRVTLE